MPVSYYYITSFNYGGNKENDVDLTCICDMGNIIPDSVFCDIMG